MGFGIPDGVCNTGLGLGLISHEKRERSCQLDQQKKKRICLKYDHIFPSLTLGPPQELLGDLKQVSSPSLAVSNSFSNSSVKKEREFGCNSEDVEVENEDEEGSTRKKLRLTKQQSAILEDSFKEHSTLNPKQKHALAEQLNLRPRQVEVWFQNRRARTKLKQTEVDCEVLKKCCERLSEENKRLQKEVQELKSMKLLYMHLPAAATLSICPSCERRDASAATLGPPNTHFYSPFSNPSAAC